MEGGFTFALWLQYHGILLRFKQFVSLAGDGHITDKAINWQWAYHPLSLFLNTGQEQETSIHHQPIDSRTYYVNFSGYPSWGDFEKITQNIYAGLNHQKTTNKIIIDMRLNGGVLSASCSQLYYSFQKKNSNGVLPDKKITPSFDDYKKGNDPVLNWILKRAD